MKPDSSHNQAPFMKQEKRLKKVEEESRAPSYDARSRTQNG